MYQSGKDFLASFFCRFERPQCGLYIQSYSHLSKDDTLRCISKHNESVHDL